MNDRYTLVCGRTGKPVAQVTRADGWWAKGWGVLGRADLPAGRGLWLPGVASIHTLCVRFPLDLLFLDAAFRTLRVALTVPPNTMLVRAPGAHHTVELGAGTLAPGMAQVGDAWQFIATAFSSEGKSRRD